MKKRAAVLGATGSIGQSALDVISRDPEKFEVVLLTAHSRAEELEKLKTRFPSAVCVITKEDFNAKDSKDAENAKNKFIDYFFNVIDELKPDITVNGIAGAAGLLPSIAAIETGSDLALANKETIVMAGGYVLKLAKEKGVNIIPVDSEHSAIFHLLEAFAGKNKITNNDYLLPATCCLNEIILTASGGPFRNYTIQQLEKVTLQDALAHPTWNMGKKITIDSASMANKGLEVIEACALFNMPPEKIKVVIHPQSVIHSMIRLTNGAVYAQMSKPDMRSPIADALYRPEISPPAAEPLNFDDLALNFYKPDTQKFPMLALAYEAARLSGLYPCAYNAANEEAVAAFIKKQCAFTDIPKITERVLQTDWARGGAAAPACIAAVLEADKKARIEAVNLINKKV